MAWYRNCSVHDRKALQRGVKMAQYITGTMLPPIQDIYSKLCLRKACSIVKDPTHPSHELFTPIPSGGRCRKV
jgi:hypothetical protein